MRQFKIYSMIKLFLQIFSKSFLNYICLWLAVVNLRRQAVQLAVTRLFFIVCNCNILVLRIGCNGIMRITHHQTLLEHRNDTHLQAKGVQPEGFC